MIGRPFPPGQSGNPKGRPKGSRHRISEKFLAELAEHFETNGKAMLDAALLESDVVLSPPSAGNPFANTVSKREANDQSDCNCNHRDR